MTTLKDLQRKLNEADNAVEARLLRDAATIRKLTEQRDGLVREMRHANSIIRKVARLTRYYGFADELPDLRTDERRAAIAAAK